MSRSSAVSPQKDTVSIICSRTHALNLVILFSTVCMYIYRLGSFVQIMLVVMLVYRRLSRIINFSRHTPEYNRPRLNCVSLPQYSSLSLLKFCLLDIKTMLGCLELEKWSNEGTAKMKIYISLQPLVVEKLWVRLSIGVGKGSMRKFFGQKILNTWAVS